MYKKREGFTLIEMLVVIAIIGILSTAVLVALNPSRNKAKDARIISSMNQARAILETIYNPSDGKYKISSGIKNSGGELYSIDQEITANQSAVTSDKGFIFFIPSTLGTTGGDTNFVAYARLNSSGGVWCIDPVNSLQLDAKPTASMTSCK